MIIEFLIASALEMSLPEFQPLVDNNGYVIVSDLDDVTGDIVASEISFDEIIIDDVSSSERTLEGLSLEAVSDDNILDQEIPLLSYDNNYLSLTTKRNTEIQIIDGLYYIKERNSYNYYIQYVLLSSGVSYDIDAYGEIYIGDDVNYDTQVYLYTNSVIIPDNDIYIIQYHHSNYYMNISISDNTGGDVSDDDVSGDDVSGDDVSSDDTSGNNGGNISADLSGIESKLDNVIIIQRSILFVLLVSFLYPIILSCVKNLKGEKNV